MIFPPLKERDLCRLEQYPSASKKTVPQVAAHRLAVWSAARRWAERAVVSGLLSVDNIRNDAGANICRRYALLRQPVLKSNVGRDGQDRPSEAAAAAVGRSQIEAVLRKANGPLIRAGFPLA